MHLIALVLFLSRLDPPAVPGDSPLRPMLQERAAAFVLIRSERTVGAAYATGLIVDVEARLALVPWHALQGARETRVLFAPPRPQPLPVSSESCLRAFEKGEAGRAWVIYAEPWHDLALVRLPKLPAHAQAIRLVADDLKANCKLCLEGQPMHKGMVWQQLKGTSTQAETVRWNWPGGQLLSTRLWQIGVREGPGPGFSGAAVSHPDGRVLGIVLAGDAETLHAIDGGTVARFFKRGRRVAAWAKP
jgi:hypothetical protein